MFKTDPISRVEWIDVRELNANDYNPNVVLNKELSLLEFSILKNGWIQPILINSDNTIIDGYHRYFLRYKIRSVCRPHGLENMKSHLAGNHPRAF